MIFDDFQDSGYNIIHLLSLYLNQAIQRTDFVIKSLILSDDEIADADLLVEEVFPKEDLEECKPSQLLFTSNALCIAVLYKGSVIASITFSIEYTGSNAVLNSLVVEKKFRSRKIGSLLIAIMHDICLQLDVGTISLISSGYGKLLYRSFGFEEMGAESFEAILPLNKKIIHKKINDFISMNAGATTVKDTPDIDKNPEVSRFFSPSKKTFKKDEYPSLSAISSADILLGKVG